MSNPLDVKGDSLQLVQRLATESEVFFLLGSFILSLDVFLSQDSQAPWALPYLNWSLHHDIALGSIFLFLLFYSFLMTVLAPLALYLIVKLTWFFANLKWEKAEQQRKRMRASGYLTEPELRRFALSSPENLVWLERANRARSSAEKAEGESQQLARLAFAFLMAVVLDAIFGRAASNTLFWQIAGYSEVSPPVLKAVILAVILGLSLVVIYAIKPALSFPALYTYVLCPFVAKLLDEQEGESRKRVL